MGARELITAVCADFTEFAPRRTGTRPADGPLGWDGYGEQRRRAGERTGAAESVRCGHGVVGAGRAVLIAFEFGFLGGSVGEESGARVVDAFDRARELRLPVVSLVASGGSRMQEGIRALTQLQTIAQACSRTRRAGLPHVAVLRDPTTGGMWAALAAGADVVLAVPGAEVAFGGSRVRPPEESGEAFTAAGKFAAGQVDRLVSEDELPAVLAGLVDLLQPGRAVPEPVAPPAPPPSPASPRSISQSGSTPQPDPGPQPAPAPETGWAAVQRARAAGRPRAVDHLDAFFSRRFALSGDRAGGVDSGMLCGIGEHEGRPVAYAAQTGTANTPPGFRTAARLVRLADRLRLPVLTLVDTPGAANGSAAELAGAGPAIGELFTAVAEARVPITTLVIGEGGSGGALALAAPGSTWITTDAYFAVIAPESAASILKVPPEQVPDLAGRLRLRPQDLLDLGFVRGILGGPPPE